ncbi:nibrin-like [Haliotis rufescens]|uniref:nibrin-like n=1 Tax=Haliotis rufescens TaxID=6454 RepID=UPI00201EC9C3|nr:nibrin-like [Haliotis rufescens]XP_046365579.2 nibrin-like [Haliotis rufescens]XP_046365659.2 nibrin-like [Haliotis rufescens]XP_048253417.1 nibrin-like [Haliotis rufescens]
MWYLVAADNPDLKYVLLVGREHTVGRKDCDILLTTDPTVSRKHSVLQLTHAESNLSHPQKSALVTLKDVSKFGTWVNKKRISGEVPIKDGDEVAFGSPKSVFLVVNEPFIITTSCLDVASKKSAKAVVRTFGGHVVSEWTKNCSLLVMNSISVTIKVICAMITQKSIVLPSYLENLLEHLKGEVEKPDPEVYLPTVSETQVNPEEVSFKPNPNRASVFEGMKFIFLSQRQFKKMNLAVELAGGMPILMEEGSDDNDDRVLVESGTVVMNCGAEDLKTLTPAGQEWVAHVNKYLKRKKKNVIQDAEIGYAVLYCSTDKHCNPDIDKAQQLFQNLPSQSLSQCVAEQTMPDVLAANTEVSPGRRRGKAGELAAGKSVVDESVLHAQAVKVKREEDGHTAATPTKRKRTEEAKEETQTEARESKRIKQEVVTPAKSQTQGRSRLEVSPKPDPDVQVTRQPKQNPSPEPKQESVAKGRGRRSPSPAAVKTAPRARSRSPSPSPSRRSARGKNVSPAREVIKDEDMLPSNPISGKGRKSVSPKPAKSQRVKDELFEELDDDFDMSVKTPTGSRISGRKSQHSHVLNDEDVEVQSGSSKTFKKVKKEQESEVSKVMPKTSPPSKANKRVLLDDSDEDDLGLWQGRRQGQKQTSRGDDSDDLMDILSSKHKKHKANTSGTRVSDEDNLFDDIPSSRTNAAQSEAARQGKVAKHDGWGARQKSPSPSPTRRVKRDVKEDSEEETITEQTRVKTVSRRQNRDARSRVDVLEVPEEEPVTAAEARDSTRNGGNHDNRTVPTGFLTTRLPIKEQTVKRDDFIKEEDIPTAVMVTQFVNLVTRHPKPPAKKSGKKDIPDGYAEWNGKLVKNFKRFRKSSHAGANFLPRIIGGSDLVEHMGSQRREMDDWFRDARQAESQENEREREAEDLFNWEPTSRNKRSR